MRRRFGALVPIELAPGGPATLVIDYQIARRILNDPEHFPADPRHWQQRIPHDCPVLPLIESRPNAFRSTEADHARYRNPLLQAAMLITTGWCAGSQTPSIRIGCRGKVVQRCSPAAGR